ncbi:MAG: hypothetical protein ACXW11_12205 [Methylotenera sp.]
MLRFISIVFLLTLSSASHGEIEKIATVCDAAICFNWWPKLSVIEGWHQDKQQSFNFKANAQAPNGYTFSDAETVIYAKAIYKPREPELTSLEGLIERDISDFKKQDPTIKIDKTSEIQTKNNTSLKSYTFFLSQNGNWEQVSYGEEGEFYLIFTISSRSKQGFDKFYQDYKRFINEYEINR